MNAEPGTPHAKPVPQEPPPAALTAAQRTPFTVHFGELRYHCADEEQARRWIIARLGTDPACDDYGWSVKAEAGVAGRSFESLVLPRGRCACEGCGRRADFLSISHGWRCLPCLDESEPFNL